MALLQFVISLHFLVLIIAGAPFGKVAMPRACSKKDSLIVVLDHRFDCQ